MTEIAKVGDTVICINIIDAEDQLILGKEYTVVVYHGYTDDYNIFHKSHYELAGIHLSYMVSRFKLKTKDKYILKTKDKYVVSFGQPEFDSIEEAEEYLKTVLEDVYIFQQGAKIGKVVASYDVKQTLSLKKL